MKPAPKLLTRDQFREGVFARDGYRCVALGDDGLRCQRAAVDAHHILERKLWTDGGYYLDNGASVCGPHHIAAEETRISCEDLRERCGITRLALPEHLYADQLYDKWANPILPNGTRMRGELFGDGSVQKILAPMLHLFTNRVKYPRTYHLPWSPGVGKDDRVATDLSHFEGKEIVVTIKMDGENTTMYRDGIHARSLEYASHPSRDKVKALHAQIAHEIPEGWRICGENLYAKHSIHYKQLSHFFQVFSIWDGLRCLSWNETVDYAGILGLHCVDRRMRGVWHSHTPKMLEGFGVGLLTHADKSTDESEGYVVRLASEFQYGAFRKSVAKYVRAGHVQTHGGWLRSQVIPNEVL